MWPYSRFQNRPNQYRPYQAQAGGLPWQAGSIPDTMFPNTQRKQQQPQQNIVVGDALTVGSPIPQNQSHKPQYIRNPLEPLVCDPKVAARNYQLVDGWKMVPVGLADRTLEPPPAEMKNRQLRYETMTSEQQIQQDEWAVQQIRLIHLNPCPAGLKWVRCPEKSRYVCTGGHHFVSDKSLAQGMPKVEWVTAAEVEHISLYKSLWQVEKLKKEYKGGDPKVLQKLKIGIEEAKKEIEKKKKKKKKKTGFW